MFGLLPPSSSVTRLKSRALEVNISRPTRVEPVKLILSTPAWLTRAAPTSAPKPGKMLTTPGGNPASRISSPSRKAVSGVISDGFKITVLPQASAGASFQLAMASGKFHGTMAATTPTGSRRVYARASPGRDGVRVSPLILVAQPAKYRK